MMASALSMPTQDSMQEAFLPGTGQLGNRMTDSTGSLTDITLEQAAIKLQEIERENMALKDNLRTHNAIVKKQYDSLTEWRKKENEKFEQTKALITALRVENQELQVKVMTLDDKEKELTQQVQSIEEEKARLQRQKAMSDQRLFNVYRMAMEQGVKGLAQEELRDAQDMSDAPVALTSEKEEIICKLETALAGKEEQIAQLRADLLKRDQEVAKCRDTTKHLLKDMESQQKLKESMEKENRMLTKQIMEVEQKLHKEMQAVMAVTKREMQTEQMLSAGASLATTGNVGASTPGFTADLKLEKFADSEARVFSFPKNVEDLVGIAKSLEAKQQEEISTDRLMKNLDEERKDKQILKDHIEDLDKKLKEMSILQEEKNKELEEVQERATKVAEKLAQDYERKLMNVTKNSTCKPIQASDTEDISILRSQVLALLREVDEAQNKLSAAMAALHHKDTRIMELDQMNQNLRKEYNEHWQETHTLIQNLQSQVSHQQKSQQEITYIRNQHEQLQYSFSTLVTDYKELQETFENYRVQMENQAPKRIRKETLEEINRLTAQVIAADEAIAQRDEQITKLLNEVAETQQQDERIQLLQFQADLYSSDFTAEREARNKLAEDKNKLAEQNDKLLKELQALQEQNRIMAEELEGYNQRQMFDMQRRIQAETMNNDVASRLRVTPPLAHDYRQQMQNYRYQAPNQRHHLPDYREATFNDRQQQQVGNTPQLAAGQRNEEDLPSFQEYECPSCAAHFPDIDSLQLHVPDCIDNNR
uniref:CCHC NOA-type domain-containing protein n=1 Tax=Arion vulgaris TaxID=1028688 RepID=A0A0B7BU47_9EUPU